MGKGAAAAGAAKGLFAPIEKWLRRRLRKGGGHHVFRGEIRRGRNGLTAGGWHHRFMGRDLPDRRVITVTQRDVTGAYDAKVEFKGPNGVWIQKDGRSTFFPDNWTPQTVHAAISEAFANGAPVPTNPNRWRGIGQGLLIEGSYRRDRKNWNSGWPLMQHRMR